MKPLLLVHGAWAGAWVWDGIKPELEQKHITVFAPTLPGQQDDLSPDLVSLDRYVEFLAEYLSSVEDKVVAVGHSGGGMVISQLAEAYPDKIDKLVYLGGMLLPSEVNYADFCQEVVGGPIGASKVMKIDVKHQYSTLETEQLKDIFYNCTSAEEADKAIAKLCPQALGGLFLLNKLTEERFGRVPKHYVRLGRDKTVLPELQDEMVRLTPVEAVHHIDTDHVPQLSAPKELLNLFTELCVD